MHRPAAFFPNTRTRLTTLAHLRPLRVSLSLTSCFCSGDLIVAAHVAMRILLETPAALATRSRNRSNSSLSRS